MARRGETAQRAFSGGEQSPLLGARADLARWMSSLEICENFVSLVQGGLTRRSGTTDVYEAQDNSRLIEFAFSGSDGYAIEIAPAPGKLRFFRDFGILLKDDLSGPYEIASPYTVDEVARLDTAQTADVMYQVCGSRPMQQLQRLANTNWAIGAATIKRGPFRDQNEDKTQILYTTDGPEYQIGDTFTLHARGAAPFVPGHVGALFRLHVPDTSKYGVWTVEVPYATNDVVIWNNNWYKCTGGAGSKSGHQPPVHLSGEAWDGGILGDGSFARKWLYLHSGFGIVQVSAYLSATSVNVTVLSYVPDDINGDAGTGGTWRWDEGAWSDYRGYPAVCAFHKKRLWLGSNAARPTAITASEIDDYTGFDDSSTDDDKAFSFDLEADSGEVNVPRWLMSGKRLALGTTHNEFVIGSADVTSPITPTSADPESATNEGSAAVPAVKVDNPVFVSFDGKRVHALAYDAASDTYVAPDLTIEAEHISGPGDTRIIRLVWLRDPYRLLVALRSDGVLLTAVYRKDQDVIGWHRHPMQGFVLDICGAPSPSGVRQDLWLKVRHDLPSGSVTRIESLKPFFERGDLTSESAWFVDGGIQYAGAPTASVTVPGYLIGATVAVRADGQERGTFTVADHGDGTGRVVLDVPASVITLGLPFTSRFRTLRYDQRLQGRNARVQALRVDAIRSASIYGGAPPNAIELLNPAGGADVDSPEPLFTGLLEVPLQSGWSDDGNVEIAVDHTGPVTIRALVPSMQVAG